ncbi:hypothetical protein BpHYR1_033349 [Brachionus plicatilis]|uniref:Uncharacterized protein n=1 Tax=Brachionus plicatilis TaxID=10195 RepID=A0A3M7PW90_BRAPC|nr:hypothetical protein BpHYR1_033349 [Brachionus plicatilis]
MLLNANPFGIEFKTFLVTCFTSSGARISLNRSEPDICTEKKDHFEITKIENNNNVCYKKNCLSTKIILYLIFYSNIIIIFNFLIFYEFSYMTKKNLDKKILWLSIEKPNPIPLIFRPNFLDYENYISAKITFFIVEISDTILPTSYFNKKIRDLFFCFWWHFLKQKLIKFEVI